MNSARTSAEQIEIASPGPAALPAAPLILIIDEVPLSRDLVRRILTAEGFRAAGAESTEEAFTVLRSASVDLILLDLTMRDCAGFEFCEQLKTHRGFRDIPVIFLSSLDDPLNRLRGLEAGGVDYIGKPFYADEVVARVRVHLRTRQALMTVAQQQQSRLLELQEAQRSILVDPEEMPEAAFAVCYRPLGLVGGDMYDVLPLGEGIFGYFVADVSGHGVCACFLTSAVKALLRQYSSPVYSAADSMRGINSAMQLTVRNGEYVTACYVRYSRHKKVLSVVSAGHPAPIHVSAGGQASTFDTESDPLGVFPSVILDEREVHFETGDRLYLYTDGLIEDFDDANGRRAAGLSALKEACERYHGLELADAARAIVDELRPATRRAGDDVLLLGVEARQ